MSRRIVVAVVLLLAAVPVRLPAIDLDVTDADIARVLAIVRGTDRERAAFHAPYIMPVADTAIESLEVVTELRRVALIAEERIFVNRDRAFASSVSDARRAIGTWKERVSVVARVRLHPLHAYVTAPAADIAVAGTTVIGTIADPLWSLPAGEPGAASSLYGVRVESSFDARSIGQARRDVTITVDRKVVLRTSIDFGRIE
jgi:hypothetical protein